MFVGKIRTQSIDLLSMLRQSINRAQIKQGEEKYCPALDRFTRSGVNKDVQDTIAYRPNRLKYLMPENEIKEAAPIERLIVKDIVQPSEKEYTEKDALLNQYSKQYRFEAYIEDGRVVTKGTPTLFLPESVSEEELETYRQGLAETGLGKEIDWQGVKSDLYWNDISFSDIQKMDMKVDYLASRYAVLKNRIETQYTGAEKDEQMGILDEVYGKGKEILADSYQDSIGIFYEELGQTGIAEDMKDSLLAAIDRRKEEYVQHLTKAGEYAHISNEEDQWLYQDDGFMAAQLRESISGRGQEAKKISENSSYSYDDLKFAGVYAKVLNEQLSDMTKFGYQGKDDYSLGKRLGSQYEDTSRTASGISLGDKMRQVIKDTFEPYINKLINRINESVDINKKSVRNNRNLAGMLRTTYIDRAAVYRGFYDYVG